MAKALADLQIGALDEEDKPAPTLCDLTHHVLLSVRHGEDSRVEHIHISDIEDEKFLEQFRAAYMKVKCILRTYLDIRKYVYCVFYRFEEFLRRRSRRTQT